MSHTTTTTQGPKASAFKSSIQTFVQGFNSPAQAPAMDCPTTLGAHPIPRTKPTIYIWPPSNGIDARRVETLSFVCNETLRRRRHILQVLDPSDHVWYDARVCGRSLNEYAEALVVFCPALLRGDVAKALSTSEINRACQSARLPLIYYPYEQKFKSRIAGDGASSSQTLTTLCGQKISYAGRDATIALTLQINDRLNQKSFCALTVDHLFRPQPQMTKYEIEAMIKYNAQSDVLQSTYLDEAEPGSSAEPSWLLNVEYVDPPDLWTFDWKHDDSTTESSDEEQSVCRLDSNRLSLAPELSADLGLTLDSTSPIFKRTGYTEPYLDWALIDLEQAQWPILPNLVSYPKGELHLVSYVVPQQELQGVLEVLIVTAGSGIVEGTLHPSYAFFANPALARGYGSELGRAQVVTFPEHHVPQPGDSGSLVISKSGYEVVGFLVAANPFGEAYITTADDFRAQFERRYPGDISLYMSGYAQDKRRGDMPSNTILTSPPKLKDIYSQVHSNEIIPNFLDPLSSRPTAVSSFVRGNFSPPLPYHYQRSSSSRGQSSSHADDEPEQDKRIYEALQRQEVHLRQMRAQLAADAANRHARDGMWSRNTSRPTPDRLRAPSNEDAIFCKSAWRMQVGEELTAVALGASSAATTESQDLNYYICPQAGCHFECRTTPDSSSSNTIDGTVIQFSENVYFRWNFFIRSHMAAKDKDSIRFGCVLCSLPLISEGIPAFDSKDAYLEHILEVHVGDGRWPGGDVMYRAGCVVSNVYPPEDDNWDLLLLERDGISFAELNDHEEADLVHELDGVNRLDLDSETSS